jgi:hypothetical protein
MPYRILLRRDNSLNWTYNDPVLMTGEPGYETDTNMFKIGDGQTPWSALDYYAGITGATGEIGPVGATGPEGASGTGSNVFYGDQNITDGNKILVNTIENFSGNTLTLDSPIVDIPTIFRLSNYSALQFPDSAGASAGGIPTGGIFINSSGLLEVRLT